jgi:hypothetical protein
MMYMHVTILVIYALRCIILGPLLALGGVKDATLVLCELPSCDSKHT